MTPRPTQRLHAGWSLVAAAVQAVASLQETDATFAPVRHFWALRNHRFFCSCLRSALLVERLGIATRLTPRACAAASLRAEKNAASAVTKRGGRPNCCWCSFDRRDQQVGVAGPLVVDLVVRDDLLFGFLDLDHLAELGGLGGLALADDLGVRLEQAHELAGARACCP